MANDKHIAIIESGVDFWNKWRVEHPEIRPDLTDADLSKLNLEDVNLSSADCSGIDLHGAYLNGANFSESDFSGANLEDANLVFAKLCGTDLQGAHLGWAKLMSADLSDADLDGIDLNYADLSFACLDGAHLTNASLEEATLVEVQANKVDISWTDLSSADLNGSDFSNANFYHSDLNGANLERTYFTDANLSDTDISSANLSLSDLTDANLSGAILGGSDLCGTDLTRANLSNADLDSANLNDANLSSANLTGTKFADADFTDAKVGFTIFVNNDLREAKGLETVQHDGPSNIGLDTVYQSQGKIPAEFLRGAGVPEELISSLISWSKKPLVHHYSCFISHSSKDQPFAERLYADLRSKGIRCWYAPEDLKAGEKFRVVIDKSIRKHDRLLLILSKNSVESAWVEKETETALELESKKKRTILLPVRIDDVVMEIENGWPADIRRTRHIGDFRGWENDDQYQKSIDRLMHELEIEQAKESST